MSTQNQPSNLNYLSPLGFRFQIKRLPNVNYFCQSVTLPTITMNPAEQQSTPFGIIPRPGDRLTYDPFVLRFRVDEDLVNYLEIENWLVGMGHPETLQQSKDFADSNPSAFVTGRGGNQSASSANFVSDATLTVLTSHKNPHVNIFFQDAFPITLTELTFDTTQADLEYLEATVTFRYRKFSIERI